MKRRTNTIYLLIICTVLFAGANWVLSWSAPLSLAPEGNVLPPISTDSSLQKKLGDFAVTGLVVSANSNFIGRLKIADGTQAAGKVLISINDRGDATWAYPPEYDTSGNAPCPPGTAVMSATGECGYQYTLVTSGLAYCNPGDQLVNYWDSGSGRNHGAYFVAPNGCYAWEGSKNYGGQSCTLECIGAVKVCYTTVGGGDWYLSGPDRKCTR